MRPRLTKGLQTVATRGAESVSAIMMAGTAIIDDERDQKFFVDLHRNVRNEHARPSGQER